jgi:hypothetical protein
MAETALIKSSLHNSVADSVYNDVITKGSNYYYFLGKTLSWGDENNPPLPIDSASYEHDTRNEIISLKAISPNDVAYVIPKIDWISGTIYDQYDDSYSTEVQGIDLISGGAGYVVAPTIIITGVGQGASATATVLDGIITSITLTNKGYGYTETPVVTFDGVGSGATAAAVVIISQEGIQRLEDTSYYVLGDNYNVYMCIDNNNEAQSTQQPYGASAETITTNDGYIWKFIYNIPISLRSKFLTNSHMPILTALQQQFYSKGNIQIIKIDARGSGYTGAILNVIGDGYLEADPLYVLGATITEVGSGYVAPTISIEPPFSNSTAWVSGATVVLEQLINYNNNYYKSVIPGTFTTSGPIHVSGIVSNGTAALQFIGTLATGTVTKNGGGQLSTVTLNKNIATIDVANTGSGYTNTPSVTISGSGGGTASAVIQNGSLNMVVVTGIGSYTITPTVTIGTLWTATTLYTTNQQIFYANRLYTVTVGGTTSSSAPTHVSGSAANGTATLTYAGIAATASITMKCGAGYSKQPVITISDVAGVNGLITATTTISKARLVPIITNGQIIGAQIIEGGIGYSVAAIDINGDGTGAQLTASLSIGDINSLQANVELLTVFGKLMNIPVVSGGYGYTSATIDIIGDGSGATATVTVTAGRVTKINIVTQGYGYTWAKATISGTGTGATARAIIPPYGGHGKNALNELKASGLMFFSDISNYKNQGFTVNNDYRQIGIIRNMYRYATTYIATTVFETACWVVYANTSTTVFAADSLIAEFTTNSRFRIVTNTGSAMLLQSLDNYTLDVGKVMYLVSNNTQTFTMLDVAPPTIDKYSGDLMYIDNRQAFTPTEQQTVTLRTIIGF